MCGVLPTRTPPRPTRLRDARGRLGRALPDLARHELRALVDARQLALDRLHAVESAGDLSRQGPELWPIEGSSRKDQGFESRREYRLGHLSLASARGAEEEHVVVHLRGLERVGDPALLQQHRVGKRLEVALHRLHADEGIEVGLAKRRREQA